MTATDDREDEFHHGRRETPTERMDRLWGDILQELRVTQTGAQLMAGFLLTLPFQSRFWELSDGQRSLYLVLVGIAVLTTTLVMTAVAVHQRLSGRHLKHRVVATGQAVVRGVVGLIALMLVGITVFIFDIVVSLTAACVAGAVVAVLLVVLLLVVPKVLVRLGDADDS
ncbi:MAG TPA: DUF6328 family protein [Nocardioides sp.]|uniref:DUF6328 family protein n=1 Tax=Nocardioides sp. TaxID=35761 RepID=UPI002EDA1330